MKRQIILSDVESDFARHGEEATGSNYTIYLEVATTLKMAVMKNEDNINRLLSF